MLCFFLTPEFVKASWEPGVGSPVHWLPLAFLWLGPLNSDPWPARKGSIAFPFVWVLTPPCLTPDAQKRKSKWDSAIPVTTIAQPTILTTTATLPAVVTVTTSASGSKTTVISAVGTIVKKAKQ